jgi:hypothetical protein
MLGDQGVETFSRYPDVYMGWPSGICLRRIARKSIRTRSVREERRTVRIIILSVRTGKPYFDLCLGDRCTRRRRSDGALQHISFTDARTYGRIGFVKRSEHVRFRGPAAVGMSRDCDHPHHEEGADDG